MGKLTYQPAKEADDGFDLGRGEFCYRRWEDGRPKWIIFWAEDAPSPMKIPLRPQTGSNGHSWELSGPEESPTLSPSVHWIGTWHGWVRNGVSSLA